MKFFHGATKQDVLLFTTLRYTHKRHLNSESTQCARVKRRSNKCPRKSMCLLTHFNVWPKDWERIYNFFVEVSYYAK